MWLLMGVVYACLCLSRENICTNISRFPQLSSSYTVVGQPIETVTGVGLLGCVHECKLKAKCDAFSYNKKTKDCNMYDWFVYSSPNNINGSDVVTSIISDWNLTQNVSRICRQSLNKDNVRRKSDPIPGQDCFKPWVSKGSLTLRRPFYNGTINVTISGKACQRWDDQTFHPHKKGIRPSHFHTGESMEEIANYCRIVLPDKYNKPWCYTAHPRQRWEECNVSECI